MEGVEVPSFFLCPISLQLMKDPVTLPTGITYDRPNIETWIFTNKHNTCPLTNQPLPSSDYDLLTPNHTLRRMIQAWCVLNASKGIERFPTPRPPVTKSQIIDLLHDATSNPSSLLSTIKNLKSIVGDSERSRSCVESSGAIDFLASVVRKCHKDDEAILDEALGVLHSLQMSEKSLDELLQKNADFVNTLTCVLRHSSGCQTRAYATLLLKSMVERVDKLSVVKEGAIVEMVKVVVDRVSKQAVKAALQVLNFVVCYGRNRIKAVEAGAVEVVIELMMEEETERRTTEMALVVLSRLSECAEGREKIVGHGAGLAMVYSKKMVRVSMVASERAIMVMYNLGKYAATAQVLKEMLEFGVVGKLCLLMQVECGARSKARVKELLALHARVWRNSPCVSPPLHASYPHDL